MNSTTTLDLDAIETRARDAQQEAPGAWHQGYAWKFAVMCPHPDGFAGPHDERVILRANDHFPHEKTIAHVGGMDPPTTLALYAAVRERDEEIARLRAALEEVKPILLSAVATIVARGEG